jgi:hypothetical protein
MRSALLSIVVPLVLACASLPDRPPHETGRFRAADLVELIHVEPSVRWRFPLVVSKAEQEAR